jgi:hypothetical protein
MSTSRTNNLSTTILEAAEMKFLFTIVLKKFKIFTYVIYIIYCYLLNSFFQKGP